MATSFGRRPITGERWFAPSAAAALTHILELDFAPHSRQAALDAVANE